MLQEDIFSLMPEEEAEVFQPKKPNLNGVFASDAQKALEKKATSSKKGTQTAGKATTAKPSAPVDQTPEYLQYKKLFCYSGHQHEIDDPALSLEQIRKFFEKVYPELSKERTEMIYQPPVLPKAKEDKKGKAQDSEMTSEDSDEVDEGFPGEELLERAESQAEANGEISEEEVSAENLRGLIIPVLKGAKKG